MNVNVDRLLDRLDSSVINREVLQRHDMARETFRLPVTTVRNHQEFNEIIQSYVQYHLAQTGEGRVSDERAFGEAKRILLNEFGKDRFQDGYEAALQMALGGSDGGMRTILNEIAEALRRRAYEEYKDRVFHHFIDPASRSHFDAVSGAFFQRFGPLLAEHGMQIDRASFAVQTRAVLEYHLRLVETILGVGKKLAGRP